MRCCLLLLSLVGIALSQICPSQRVQGKTADGYLITCSIEYDFDQQSNQCRFTSCYNSCPFNTIVYTDQSFCKNQCPYVKVCSAVRVGDTDGDGDGSSGGQGHEKSQSSEGGGSSLSLGAILGIVGGVLGVVLLIIIIYNCRKNNSQNLARQNLPAGSSEGRIDEKDIYLPEIIGSQESISNGNVCSICIIDKANVSLKCGHMFHPKCIFTWMKKNDTCPLCRQKARNTFKISCKKCLCSLGTRTVLRQGENFRCEKCDPQADNSANCSNKGIEQQLPL